MRDSNIRGSAYGYKPIPRASNREAILRCEENDAPKSYNGDKTEALTKRHAHQPQYKFSH